MTLVKQLFLRLNVLFKKKKVKKYGWIGLPNFSRFGFLNFTFLLKCKSQVNKKHFPAFLGGWGFQLAFFSFGLVNLSPKEFSDTVQQC